MNFAHLNLIYLHAVCIYFLYLISEPVSRNLSCVHLITTCVAPWAPGFLLIQTSPRSCRDHRVVSCVQVTGWAGV